MSEVWVARCILTARPGAKPFWGADLPRVAVRMMLIADSAAAFEAAVRASAQVGGAKLVSLGPVERATEVRDAAIQAALPRATAVSPLLVESPIAAPVSVPVQSAEQAWDQLTPAPDLWAVIDGVSWDNLPADLASCAQASACIYSSADPQTLAVAPWLVQLDRAGGAFDLIRNRSCEEHTSILLRSPLSLTALRKHLRRYTMLRMPGGDMTPKYFRFYDPRVMLDLCDAFEPERLARFFDPLDAVLVPLSPECLMPSGAFIDNAPFVFADPATCQGRLLELRHTDPTVGDMAASYPISPSELSRFGQRASLRAHGVLARWIHENYGDLHDPVACTRIAQEAGAAGPRFGLKSVKQVQAMAKCIAVIGSDFWLGDAEARRILTARGMLPWQRKDAILSWLQRATSPSRRAG